MKYLTCLVLLVAACATEPNARECTTGIICPEGTKCAAAQEVCITNDCGDAIVQSTEKCDDGNILDGDGCSHDCLSREICGDGVVNAAAGELCDDGNTTGGDGCSADCKSLEQCGNGIRDVNEVCDDGNTVPGDGCSGNCKSTEICGNNIVDINEKCDDGGAPGGCNDDCQGGTGCGDGAIDKDGSGNALEECDDGNTDNFDDCTNNCHLNKCGDGIVQASGNRIEQCDPSVNFIETSGCNLDCTNASCGDGKINKARGEECDNGAGNNDDARDCTASCKVNVCGDGHPDTLGPNHHEECDDMNLVQTDGCSNQCTTHHCGNGVRETLEACDDGNLNDGDGCSSTCQFESCGDGIQNNGEDCDPGPMVETPTCNANCTTRACGDSIINKAAGEECDDGNNVDFDSCRKDTCKINVCGDNNKSATEACDDGNRIDNDGCNNICALPSCGDGIINGSDQCDDGTANNGLTKRCLPSCILNVCGDGNKLTGVEECDNGAGNGIDKDCTPLCKDNTCGDGFRDQEGSTTEACDDGNKSNEASCPYGIATCNLCNQNCTAVEANLTGKVCGDGGAPDSPQETCDDGNAISETTCPYGARSDTVNTCAPCNASCTATLSLSTGSYCGDAVTDSANGEACDDNNALACGTCDATCNNATGAAVKATGIIITPGSGPYNDNDTLQIGDGFGHTITLEFDASNNGVTTGNIKVTTSPNTLTSQQMRDNIEAAISGATIDIAVTDAGSAGVLLTNTHFSKAGNVPFGNSVATSSFYANGMSGGVAGDCPNATQCKSNDDCLSHNCTGSPKVCAP